jgi:hypothetical protein
MSYLNIHEFNPDELHIYARNIGARDKICVAYGPTQRSIAFVTPPSKTNYPRVSGDGDFREGAQYGPQTVDKCCFVIDMNGSCDESEPIDEFFTRVVQPIDAKILDFMHLHQLRFLGRKNLSKDELGMLQIKSVAQNYSKETGALMPNRMNLKCRKFYNDQVGNKRERQVAVCDCEGRVLEHGSVSPGDVVSCTMHMGDVYYGVGGDKFGVSWQLEDVAVLCQEQHKKQKTDVSAFASIFYTDKHAYEAVTPTAY